MSDASGRGLERAAARGDDEALRRLQVERCRTGQCCAHAALGAGALRPVIITTHGPTGADAVVETYLMPAEVVARYEVAARAAREAQWATQWTQERGLLGIERAWLEQVRAEGIPAAPAVVWDGRES